ncbi:MAG: membrane protein insertase YidC [bacterium]|nr:membrane protein insertase YidC [bacterium]
MEKNTILAIVLSLLVLLGWQQFVVAPRQQEMLEEQARQEESARQDGQTDNGAPLVPVGQGEDMTAVGEALPSHEDQQRQIDENAEEILIETPLIQAVITTQGARIKSWQLLAHKDLSDEPVQLVSTYAQQRGQYPLEQFTGEAELDQELNSSLYTSSAMSLRLESGDEAAGLTLSYRTENAGLFTKEFLFHADSYAVDVTTRFHDPSFSGKAISITWGPGTGMNLEDAMRFEAGVVSKSGGAKPERDAAKKIDGLRTHQNVEWGTINRKYFTAALFPSSMTNSFSIQKLTLQATNPDEKINPVQQLLIGLSQPLSDGECGIRVYAGPKERSELERTHQGFEKLIDYGFFGFIAEPLALFMDYLYLYVNNYGVVIICLTIMIKILFFPLTYKSFSSMKRMQDIQPEMKKLQGKFKDDKQRLNQEMMGLYKEKGVNPMGGCLPMVLQIPVFFALYQTLSQSIELRGATFLWVSDLSATETLFFKPLVLMMGASMFLQQSMTPTATDNKQAQIFKFMPILFTAMFWSFPAGLVLYWFMNNILTIGQQYMINRKGTPSAKKSKDTQEDASPKSYKRRKKGK